MAGFTESVINRPAKPTGLTLTAGDEKLTASWTAPTATGGSAITGYDVERKVADAADSTYAAVTRADAAALTETITGLTNGVEHTVRVRATNGAGNGPWSAEASETPAVPASKNADLADLRVEGVTVAGFDKDTLSYEVVVVLPSASLVTIETSTVNDQARVGYLPVFTDANVASPGYQVSVLHKTPTTYTITVTSADGSVTKVYAIEITRYTLPGAPGGLNAQASYRQVELSWNDPDNSDIDSYQYRVSDDGGNTWDPDWTEEEGSDASTTGLTLSGLDHRTEYRFEVRAVVQGAAGAAASVTATPDDDFPNDTTTTGEVDVGGSVTGTIEFGDDVDWVKVDLEADTRYQIDLEGADTGRGTLVDPAIEFLADSMGDGIADTEDSDNGVGKNARAIYTPTAAGAYYVSVSSETSAPGTYTVSVIVLGANGASEADTDFPDTTTTTGRVEVGASATGNIHTDGNRDSFRVDLEVGKTYQIDLEGAGTNRGSLVDPQLFAIADSTGSSISGAENNDISSSNLNSRVTLTPTATGSYYVLVRGNGTSTGTYTLSVGVLPTLSIADAEGEEDDGVEFTATLTAAVSGKVTATWTASIESGDTAVAADLTATKTGEVEFDENATSAKFTVPVNDDTIEEENETFTVTLSAVSSNALLAADPTAKGTILDDCPADTTTTCEVDVGGSATGTGGTLDKDWFRVVLEAGTRYQIDMEGADTGRGTLVDPAIEFLADSMGDGIADTEDSDNGVGKNARAIYTPTASGTYYVQAANLTGLSGTYTVSVIVLGANGASEADTDFPDTTSTTGRVEVGASATGNIHTNGNRDSFRVDLERGKTYQIDLEGAGTNRGSLDDPQLLAIAYDGSSLSGTQNNDISSSNLNSRVTLTPTATGSYHVLVRGNGTRTGTYTLSVRDVTPPGLNAQASYRQVELSWNDPDNSDIDSYQYRVSDDGGNTWDPDWTEIEGSDASTTGLTLTGLDHRTEYRFEVRVVVQGAAGAAASVTATPAGIGVPHDWDLRPPGIATGETFRLLIVTSDRRNGQSGDVDDYNDHVQDAVASGHSAIQDYSSGFRALVGTRGGASPRDNTHSNKDSDGPGEQIWWLNGPKAADNYADFYDGDWDHTNPVRFESGNPYTFLGYDNDEPHLRSVWTGARADGRRASTNHLGNDGNAYVGAPYYKDSPLRYQNWAWSLNARIRLYGLSPVFLVEAPDAPYATRAAITTVPPNGTDYQTGEVVKATVTFSEDVTVTGTPQLPLQIGGEERDADYAAGDSSSTVLSFSYVVTDDDTDMDGISINAFALKLNGGSIKRTDTNVDAALTHTRVLTDDDHKVNLPPLITGVEVTSTPQATNANDTYGLGEDIEITVTFSEAVTVTGDEVEGDVEFGLSVGGAVRARLKSGSETTELVFAYTVQSGDDDDNGIWIGNHNTDNPTFDLQGGQSVIGVDSGRAALLEHSVEGTQGDHKVDGSLTGADATLSSLTLSGITLVPAFAPGTTAYAATTSLSSTTVTATASQSGANMDIDPDDADTNMTDHDVNLAEGDTVITVTVISTNGDSTRTYTVTVTREAANGSRSAPPPPQNVRAVEEKGGVRLTWQPPDGSAVTGYRIERRRADENRSGPQRSHGQPRDHHTLVEDTGSADTGYTDESAEQGVEYEYRVSARNEAGPGGGSGWVRAGPASASNNPATGAPTISGTAQVGETLTADITGIADADGLSGETFTYQWVSGDGTTDTDIENATGATYTLADADQGKSIKVRVTFTDGGGNEETLTSTPTGPVLGDGPPGAPRNLAATAGNKEVTLSWEPPDDNGNPPVKSYRIQWRIDGKDYDKNHWGTARSTTYTTNDQANLANGVKYFFRVKAGNGSGNSYGPYGPASGEVSATPTSGSAVDLGTPVLSDTENLHHGMVELGCGFER